MKLPIYLDYSATTPVDPRVAEKMIPYLCELFGNPASRSHSFGWVADAAVEEAREQVAALVNADPKEIVWTSGATESNNLAIKGACHFYAGTKGKHIITVKTEHKAVLDTVREMERQGFEATYLDVGDDGLLDLGDRLDPADLVVHEHHRNHDGVGADRRLQHLEVDQAVLLNVEIGRLEALALEFAHRVEHGLVLGLHRDDVLALALVEMRRALDGEVVRFGRTRGPDDLLGVGIDQCGDLFARILDRLLGFPAVGVRAARRVAEVLGQPGDHLGRHARVDRSRRRIVEVDGELQHCVSPHFLR